MTSHRHWRRWIATVCLWPAVASAFRTTADAPGFDGVAARWSTPSVGFYFHAEGAPGLSLLETQRRAVDGWFLWQEPVCSAIRISNLGDQHTAATPGDGRNTIQWAHDWSARGFDPTAAGVTDLQYENVDGAWTIVEADIYLNAEHFTWAGEGSREVASVISHEMGHALGLLHPCEPDGSDHAPLCTGVPTVAEILMHPFYASDQIELSADDAAGICFLYPRPTCEETGCPAGQSCTERGCEAACAPECEPDRRCVGGRCVGEAPECPASAHCAEASGTSSFGDPCGSGAECRTGVCTDEGTCSVICASDAECSAVLAVCHEGLCVSDLGGLGAACSESDQCLGGECLRIDGRQPACTRLCQSNVQCSMGWTCQTIEDRQVCARRAPPSKGCSITVHDARPFLPFEMMGLLLFMSWMVRVRQRLWRERVGT